MKNHAIKYFCIAILCLIIYNSAFAANKPAHTSGKRIKIAFLISRPSGYSSGYSSGYNSNRAEDKRSEIFFNDFFEFMGYAVKDLGIDFKQFYFRTDSSGLEKDIKNCISRYKPDVFIFLGFLRNSKNIIQVAEKEHIPSFTVNAGFRKEDKMGEPRGKYKYWIGEMIPDDEYAGYKLAKILIEKAPCAKDGKIHMIGMTSPYTGSNFIKRISGLKRAVHESGNVILDQVFSTSISDFAVTKRKFMYIKKSRYPDTCVVWAISDSIALNVIEEAKELKLRIGRDFITGGIDWTDAGLKAIQKGDLAVSMGGHFMEGAWAAVLLYDYFNGKDFVSEGVKFKSRMSPIYKNNANEFISKLAKNKWKRIKFRNFSKIYNHDLKKYDFSLQVLLKQLK